MLDTWLGTTFHGLIGKDGGWMVECVVRLAACSSHGSFADMMTGSNPYRGFRYPAEIIQHAVELYHCFSLSLRDVELILVARSVVVSYDTIREWGLRFGQQFANALKRHRPRPDDKWHLDGAFVRVRGKLHYLWRAVDQHGIPFSSKQCSTMSS